MSTISSVPKQHRCVQCGACYIACPNNSIEFDINNNGLYLPRVKNTCIDCSLCRKVCPTLNTLEANEDEKKYYISTATDQKLYDASSSGGTVSAMIQFLFDEGMINKVLCTKSVGKKAVSLLVDSFDEYVEAMGSKYQTSSGIKGIEKIEKDDKIAVVGLPCQIRGLCNLLRENVIKKKQIVIKIGLFCVIGRGQHAVDLETKKFSSIDSIRFREGNEKQKMVVIQNRKNINLNTSENFRYKYDFFFTPKSCLTCSDIYNENADISLGDAWNISTSKSNAVIINTEVGKNIFKDALSKNYIKKVKNITKEDLLTTQKNAVNFKLRHQGEIEYCLSNKKINTTLDKKYMIGLYMLRVNSRVFVSKYGKIIYALTPKSLLFRYRNIMFRLLFREKHNG